MRVIGLEHYGVEANGSAIFAGCARTPTATCGNNGYISTFCLRCNEQGIRPLYGYSSELSEDDEPATQVELPYRDDAAEGWVEAPCVAACDVDADQGPGSHDDDERDRNTSLTTDILGCASDHAEEEQEATFEHCNE